MIRPRLRDRFRSLLNNRPRSKAVKVRALPAEANVVPAGSGRSGTLAPAIRRDEERVGDLQRALGIRFTNSILLRDALTHRSYLNEVNGDCPSNERLEFLGDAVLQLIATDYLYRLFPEEPEGELTNLRSALVRTETLARFAEELDLGQFLFLGKGEEMSHGRNRPSSLACAYEALLGALYLDKGYEIVKEFTLPRLETELSEVQERRLHRNAKSSLQELVQGRMKETPAYRLVEESGPDHAKTFVVEVRVGHEILGQGRDRSKRGAEQEAAQQALTRLSGP